MHPFEAASRRFFVLLVALLCSKSKQITLDVRSSRLMHLSRQIEACGSDVAKCLSLLEIHKNEDIKTEIDSLGMERVYLQALQVVNMAMKKNRDGDKGYLLNIGMDLQRNFTTDTVRARMITICGNCGAFHEALDLLRESDSIQCYNAALAACGKNGEWEQTILLLEQMTDRSVLSCNIVLGALAQKSQGILATNLLRNMTDRSDFPAPDQQSLQHAMRAIIAASGDRFNSGAALLLLKEFWTKTSSRPNNSTIDLLSKAHYRMGDWKVVKMLESIRHDGPLHLLSPDGESNSIPDDPPFAHWDHPALHKVRSGASSHWEFGSLFMETDGLRFTLALKPNRDPSKNGIRLVVLDSLSGEKVGYLLMINGCEGDSAWSRLLGLFIRPDMRKLGLSKALLAVWLRMCVEANLRPGAGVIRKPLLSMVLEHTFGFLPDSQPTNPSTVVEIIPRQQACDDAKLKLYAPASKSLQGVFTPRELERDQIEVLLDTPSVRGKRCHIGASFSLVLSAEEIRKLVAKQLNRDNRPIHICTNQDLPWRLTMLGKHG